MCANDVTLEVGDESYPGRLNTPEESTDQGILLIPGAGHGPFGDIFLRFGKAGAEAGYEVARFETWPFPSDLESKTEEEFAADLAAGVEFLQSRGCSTITIVAKSFGGQQALEHLSDGVDRMVLWAPAVELDEQTEGADAEAGADEEGDGDADEKETEMPSIRAEELAGIEIPVRILQGDEDRNFSVEGAGRLVDHLPQGELVELPGEDHSFLRDHERVMAETMAFLPE